MNKNQLSEDDISVKFITPALHKAGWDEETQVRRQVSLIKGRVIMRGKLVVSRGKSKKADFVFYYQCIPFVFSSNGNATQTLSRRLLEAVPHDSLAQAKIEAAG